MRRSSVTLHAGLLLVLLRSPLDAQPIPSEFEAVERIVAVGDVHGAYDTLVENLKATGLVDSKLDWVGGKTHFVQTGDVLDRGPDSRKAMDLLMKLEPQAEAAGGKVHVLIGNHEFWNAVGDSSYVSKQELESFDGKRDRVLRKLHGEEEAPRGALALQEAYSAEGEYGKWIRGKSAVIRIGDFVFVHGGVTPEVAELGLTEINRRVRADLDSATWPESFSMQDDGPLMTRRYSGENLTDQEMAALAREIGAVLLSLGARTMVMGHTVTFGLIEPRFDGAAILIDTGMFEGYLGGHQAALALENGRAYAMHTDGKVELPGSLQGETGALYIKAVVEAAPGDSAVKHRLAGVLFREDRHREAAELYEAVGVFDPRTRLPYSWRREAAECYQALGEERKATALYELYLQGLGTYAARAGSSRIQLLNSFARECLRLGLESGDAFEAARQATAAYPKNLSYKVTLAWAYLERGDAHRAARVLSHVLRLGGDSFYAYLILGRAHAALGRRDQALEAFRRAQEYRPGDVAVEEAMRELMNGTK